MKKVLLEYLKVFGYAVTGLIFGLSFFLLFLNFYHAREVNLVVDVTADEQANAQNIQNKLNVVKQNSASYNQKTYRGSHSIYDMNGVQIRLNRCVEVLEGEKAKQLTSKTKVTLKDVYDLNYFYRNDILNDCVVMQLNAFSSNSTMYQELSSLATTRPFVTLNINYLLKSEDYVAANLENGDSYYFSNDMNRGNVFNLVLSKCSRFVSRNIFLVSKRSNRRIKCKEY